jgi:hypothetical protein
VRRIDWAWALRPMAALGVALLAGCGGDVRPGRYYGGGYGSPYYGGPGYYGSPYYGYDGPFGGYNRYYGGPRHYGGGFGGGGAPPRQNWSQDRLRQHWMEQLQRPR